MPPRYLQNLPSPWPLSITVLISLFVLSVGWIGIQAGKYSGHQEVVDTGITIPDAGITTSLTEITGATGSLSRRWLPERSSFAADRTIETDARDTIEWIPGHHGICPICYREHLKSKVYISGCYKTLLRIQFWYDEDGNYHLSDPNTTVCAYYCSVGHEWKGRE